MTERVYVNAAQGDRGLIAYVTVKTEGHVQFTEAPDVLALAARLQAIGEQMQAAALERARRKLP